MPSLSTIKCLVTGAGGFIGSHLAEALVREGASVTALVRYNAQGAIGNLSHAAADTVRDMRIVFGNVEDSEFVDGLVRDADIVFHLAALIGIPYSYAAPRSYLRTNVEGTLNILEAARRHGTRRLIHTSTSEVYGSAIRTPMDEQHPCRGQSPYSASKIGADRFAESYFRSFNLPVVTIRPFNTFGPRQSARAFIPSVASQALSDLSSVRVGSLDTVRDMTFVEDTAAGFIAAATAAGVEGEEINLGTGTGYTMREIALRILALSGRGENSLQEEEARIRPAASEVNKLISDNSKARTMLDWTPRYDLDQGLSLTIDFIRRNSALYSTGHYVV
ncbi:SDR family NAD(P)-dependent oxidoreductase [Azospirillum sp. TSH64]|uniref:SDR family NAD(P)-dependent oxidoreductase n=1 Tax=Azospirillum sp. TSH64 TaxID=652740 RepID=UPI000D696483|nr:SDR family NAD(P)-dependent oxidoreductase [Azospirillum sp. TSH64]